jgi:hypothetical protein
MVFDILLWSETIGSTCCCRNGGNDLQDMVMAALTEALGFRTGARQALYLSRQSIILR